MSAPLDEITQNRMSEATKLLLLRAFAVGTMTFFLAVASQISIPTDPLGIPISLQTLAVVLTAITLGPRLGVLSVLLYIVTGAIGVRVFADNHGGWITLIGQSGGYILGFLVCQPIVGWIIRRRDREIRMDDGSVRLGPGSVRGFWAILFAAIVAHVIVFAIGVPWLYWVHVLDDQTERLSWGSALYLGMVVFLPGMVLKSALAAIIGVRLAPACARRVW